MYEGNVADELGIVGDVGGQCDSCTGMGNMDDVLFLGIKQKHVQTSTMGYQITVYQLISTNTNPID